MYGPKCLKAISRWRGDEDPRRIPARYGKSNRDAHLQHSHFPHTFPIPTLGSILASVQRRDFARNSSQKNFLSGIRDRYPGRRTVNAWRGLDLTDERDSPSADEWTGLESLYRRSGGPICGRGTLVEPRW